jgi:P27 family predicted phage terminase small subunit
MRGRRSQSPAAKKLRGTQRPALASTVAGLPDPPFPLSDRATAHYERLGAVLIAKGRLAESDADALAIYAGCAALLESADVQIAEGFTVPGQRGSTKSNPAVAVRKDCLAQMTKILSLFGCTPADRNRLGVAEAATDTSDRLSLFLGRKNGIEP